MKTKNSESKTVASPVLTTTADPTATSRPSTPWSMTEARYDISRVLGQGGMATVHLGFDRILLREVALKRLEHPLGGGGPDLARFISEAQITAQLDHPNIVPVHDLSLEGGSPYFVMKVLGGRTLAETMEDEPPAPRDTDSLDELLHVFLKVCDAIAFSHSRGVVHRDLKPHNVMVDTYGRVYVVDWGLARVLPGSTAAQVQVARTIEGDDGSGTVAYMAPEQAQTGWRPIGPATDVFALGAILYEILCGRPPHDGTTKSEVLESAFQTDIVPPDVLHPGRIPGGLSRIAMRAMAREPADRYASADELKREVERFLRGGARFRVRSYAPGETVIVEGEVGDTAFVIAEGTCRAYKTVDGQRVILRDMGPGDVFGEMAVFSEKPRSATVEALEGLVVREVGRDILSDGLGLDTWMGAFVRALSDRFREVEERLAKAEKELAKR